MKKYVAFAAAFSALALTGGANAADLSARMPVKAAPMVAPAFSWTGCYLGADVGVAWARDRDDETVTATGAPSGFSPASAAKLTGAKAGGYLGCNYQISQVVLGVEGDGEWTSLRGSADFTNTGTPPDSYEAKIRWQASIRGRLGYAWDRALLYVTGGAAFADINEHDQNNGVTSTDNSTTRTGWTVGGGLDYAFTANLIGRIEYRYADFGTFSYQPIVFGGFTENHKITEHAVRIGLAYKFF